jgi:putative membrane protein
VIGVGTAAVERFGTRSGWPFGRYRYTAALRPQVAGVPAIVPLAWFAMAVPARATVHAALGARSTPVGRIIGGAAALTAWDVFLDPQMVGEGYWAWARRGAYRGIPLSNFVGWFATGVAVMGVLESILPAPDEPEGDLVGEYAAMATMETVGFAAFFRDRLVAAVGGAAMLPFAVAGVVGALRGRS